MTEAHDRQCFKCEFFDTAFVGTQRAPGSGTPLNGLCRRESAQVYAAGDTIRSGWPVVGSGEWCGEYVLRTRPDDPTPQNNRQQRRRAARKS